MRALVAGERALLAGPRLAVHARAEVRDSDLTWRNASSLQGYDFFDDAEWGWSPDDLAVSAIIRLRRKASAVSLAPLIGASPINRDVLNAYVPLLEADRMVRLYTATVLPGVAPLAGDWRRVFDGRIDKVNSAVGKNQIVLNCRDLGALLNLPWVEEPTQYGSAAPGTAMQTVMQEMINQWWVAVPGLPTPTVVTPVDPLAYVQRYTQARMPLMQALRDLAMSIGWRISYEWGAGDTLELRFYNLVEKGVSDATFTNAEYLSLTELETSDADIRNVIWARGFNTASQPIAAMNTDDASILKYRRRYMEIQEDTKSHLRTQAQLQRLADAARDALGWPYATHAIETLYFWPVQGGDRHTYQGNADHYDSDQTLYVTGYKHRVGGGTGRTTIMARGKPVARYFEWYDKAQFAAGDISELAPSLDIIMVSSTASTVTYRPTATIRDDTPLTLFYGYGDDPLTTIIANGGDIVVPRSTNSSDDRLLRVVAVAENGLRDLKTVVVDYDTEPELKTSGDPEPLYSGSEQVGWRLKGTVDDDCRAFVIQITGDATIQSVSPVGVVTGAGPLPGYWSPTTSTKTFTIELLQGPGQEATVTLTPVEFYVDTAPGLVGKPTVKGIARAPITLAVVGPWSGTERLVTLSPRPSTALTYWRTAIGAGLPFTQYTGPVVVSVANAYAEFEFYSAMPGGAQEPVKRIVLDEDWLPEIVYVLMSEEGANNLRISYGPDDDVGYVRIWVRRGSAPVDANGNPDEKFLRYAGTTEKRTLDMRASGNGDGTSTWFAILRAYSGASSAEFTQWPPVATPLVFVEGNTKKLITGPGAPAVGSLSNLQSSRQTIAAVDYHVLTWNHNQEVQDVAHTVTVRENGTQVSVGRDARTESDNLNAVALLGGVRFAKTFAEPTDPGAVFLTFDYEVDLKLGGTVLATYTVSQSGWYAGSGGGGGPPPTETPGTPDTVTSIHPGGVRATWVNTSNVWDIEVRWEFSDFSVGPPDSGQTVNRAPATTQDTVVFPANRYARARVRYYNADGQGPWSGWSTPWRISGSL